ncbi:MAG: DUF2520 domain-containing protein [Bacteroides sp.]|nr:DUF2520 domain-containing protein [Bacteroidales bacterium]MBD5369468.1 DUF2520 domain-containing protein [Bacteroides sp.]
MSTNSEIHKPQVVVIGSGNVASALAVAIENSGAGSVIQIYSRNIDHARALASRLECAATTDSTEDISADADIYLVSLADDAVTETLTKIRPNDALWLHTSGSLDMDVLSGMSDRYGVFYPLQTFSRNRKVDLSAVTLFTEGSSPAVEDEIARFGEKIFRNIIHADSVTRSRMHVAAVFACNFSNYMWSIAYDLLSEDGIPFDVLGPLLRETLDKALSMPPREGQTGPARRADQRIIEAHASSLPPKEEEIYRLLSKNIIEDFYGKQS